MWVKVCAPRSREKLEKGYSDYLKIKPKKQVILNQFYALTVQFSKYCKLYKGMNTSNDAIATGSIEEVVSSVSQ